MTLKRNIRLLTVQPTLTNLVYVSGEVMGAPVEVPDAFLNDQGNSVLESIVVIDKDGQSKKFDVIFFEAQPSASIGADGAAYALTDADADLLLGRASIQDNAYAASTNNSEATFSGLGLPLQAETGRQSLWVAFVARDPITLTNAANLKIRIGLIQG